MLDIRTYDIAVTERIKQYFKNTHFIMRQSLPIQEIRDRKLLNGEDVEFPIILVRRTNCPIFSKSIIQYHVHRLVRVIIHHQFQITIKT